MGYLAWVVGAFGAYMMTTDFIVGAVIVGLAIAVMVYSQNQKHAEQR